MSYTTGSGSGRQGGWIQLKSGKPFWPLDPRPGDIDIRDIAWSLSMQCRFAGHSLVFYSVAEHSWLVSHAVPASYALYGLLHDATEAYLQDLVQPIKNDIPSYRAHEDRLWQCIAQRFGLSPDIPDVVKEIDRRMLATEKRDILSTSERDWQLDAVPLDDVDIVGISPWHAYRDFLSRFRELTRQRYPDGYSSEASKARVDVGPNLAWAHVKVGERSICSQCRMEILYTPRGSWRHKGTIQPRHVALPVLDNGVAIVLQPGEHDIVQPPLPFMAPHQNQDAVRRASVGPMPGDVAICLHCQDQIVFSQYGQWRHHEKQRDEDHIAEPIPF